MGTAKQMRRTDWSDSRERLLETARELFASRGYKGATTRELAHHAGVSLMTLHRHFPTKADLFDAAVLAPLADFVEDYINARPQRLSNASDSAAEMTLFYSGLLDVIFSEDKLLIAAANAFSDDDQISPEMREHVAAFFDKLEEVVAARVDDYDLAIDPRIAPRVMVGMALGLAIHGSWMFPTGPKPTRDQLVDELVKITIWGVAGKPGKTLS